jgi:serine/threonine protein kinase
VIARDTKNMISEMIVAMEGIKKLGVFHRDIKPCNILFDKGGHVTFGDFGLALTGSKIGKKQKRPERVVLWHQKRNLERVLRWFLTITLRG